METIINTLQDHTFQTVATGTAILGLLSGFLGVFLTLRRQSLLGDALGHSALPGIAIAFLLIQEKNFVGLLIGAAISGLIASLLIQKMSVKTKIIKQDSALSLVLSTFFGLGIALMTYIQKFPNAAQSGIDHFIFGQASGMLLRDVNIIKITALIIGIILIVFWKEFKLITFDAQYARTLSRGYMILPYVLTLLIVITIVLGLESVGVILISAMLINPAIAARYWSNRMSTVMILSGLFGVISSVIGTLISSIARQIPTGPSIVIVITTITLLSVLLSPQKGLIARRYRIRQHQKQLNQAIQSGKGEA